MVVGYLVRSIRGWSSTETRMFRRTPTEIRRREGIRRHSERHSEHFRSLGSMTVEKKKHFVSFMSENEVWTQSYKKFDHKFTLLWISFLLVS